MKNQTLAAALVALALVGAPVSADVPDDDLTTEPIASIAAAEGPFDVEIACLTPGFGVCAIAAAFAAGGCKDIAKWEVCIGVAGGAVGTITSFSAYGGAAAGEVNGVPDGCSWGGGNVASSGGCMSGGVELNFACPAVEVTAEGLAYLVQPGTVPPAVEDVIEELISTEDLPVRPGGALVSPPAAATAEADCDLLNLIPDLDAAGTIQEIVDELGPAETLAQLQEMIDEYIADAEAQIDALRTQIEEEVQGADDEIEAIRQQALALIDDLDQELARHVEKIQHAIDEASACSLFNPDRLVYELTAGLDADIVVPAMCEEEEDNALATEAIVPLTLSPETTRSL